jgi:PAS domain S-box-containing protein
MVKVVMKTKNIPQPADDQNDDSIRKEIRSQIHATEDVYQYIFENSVVAKTITLPDGTITPNKAFYHLLGYEADENPLINWREITHPDDIEATQAAINQLIAGPCETARFEKRYIHRNGSVIWVDLSSSLRKTPDGKPMYFISTILDITQRKTLEQQLIRNEANFRSVVENLPIGIAVNSVDPVVQFSYMNQLFPKFYRTTRENLESPDIFWESVYEDPVFREQIKERVLDDILSNDPSRMNWEDIPITRKGEETTYISARNIPIPNSPLLISTVWDVTERKRAELQLSKLSEELQMMFDNMINALVIWESVFDEQGNYVSFRFGKFNHTYSQIAQLDYEQVRGKDVFEVWPETERTWVDVYGKVATTGQAQVFDMYHKPTGGWYHCNAYRPTSSPEYICVIFEDVTRARQDADNLQKMQRLLNETQKIAGIGGWQLDVATGHVTWTQGVYDIHGASADFDPSDSEKNIQMYLPDDQSKLSDALQQAITNGISYDLELQLEKLTGEVIWVRTIGIPESEGGKIIRIIGYVMDITSRKKVETRIADQLQELQRWQHVLLDREDRTIQLKQEVNELSARLGEKPRYLSVTQGIPPE